MLPALGARARSTACTCSRLSTAPEAPGTRPSPGGCLGEGRASLFDPPWLAVPLSRVHPLLQHWCERVAAQRGRPGLMPCPPSRAGALLRARSDSAVRRKGGWSCGGHAFSWPSAGTPPPCWRARSAAAGWRTWTNKVPGSASEGKEVQLRHSAPLPPAQAGGPPAWSRSAALHPRRAVAPPAAAEQPAAQRGVAAPWPRGEAPAEVRCPCSPGHTPLTWHGAACKPTPSSSTAQVEGGRAAAEESPTPLLALQAAGRAEEARRRQRPPLARGKSALWDGTAARPSAAARWSGRTAVGPAASTLPGRSRACRRSPRPCLRVGPRCRACCTVQRGWNWRREAGELAP